MGVYNMEDARAHIEAQEHRIAELEALLTACGIDPNMPIPTTMYAEMRERLAEKDRVIEAVLDSLYIWEHDGVISEDVKAIIKARIQTLWAQAKAKEVE